jgi:hypothetical protein
MGIPNAPYGRTPGEVVIGAPLLAELLNEPRANTVERLISTVRLLREVSPAGFAAMASSASLEDGT